MCILENIFTVVSSIQKLLWCFQIFLVISHQWVSIVFSPPTFSPQGKSQFLGGEKLWESVSLISWSWSESQLQKPSETSLVEEECDSKKQQSLDAVHPSKPNKWEPLPFRHFGLSAHCAIKCIKPLAELQSEKLTRRSEKILSMSGKPPDQYYRRTLFAKWASLRDHNHYPPLSSVLSTF